MKKQQASLLTFFAQPKGAPPSPSSRSSSSSSSVVAVDPSPKKNKKCSQPQTIEEGDDGCGELLNEFENEEVNVFRGKRLKKKINYFLDSDDESETNHCNKTAKSPKKKRKKEKDDEDYKDDGMIVDDVGDDYSDQSDGSGEEEFEIKRRTPQRRTPTKSRTIPQSPSTPSTPTRPQPRKQQTTPLRSSSSSSSSSSSLQQEQKREGEDWEPEERFRWIHPDHVMDSSKRRPDHPDYDPSTLYVPLSEYQKMGGFAQQWWDAKKNHFDCVIFFRKGYFYELFNQDAEIGRKELNLKVTNRGEMKLAGIPITQLEPWAARVVQQGFFLSFNIVKKEGKEKKEKEFNLREGLTLQLGRYKVAIAEELETAIGMEKRKSNSGTSAHNNKKSTVIRREVVKVLTAGTLCDESMFNGSTPSYLLSIEEDKESSKMGFCVVDTSIGLYQIGEFPIDQNYSQFETLLLQLVPKEILSIPPFFSRKAQRVVEGTIGKVVTSHLSKEKKWSPEETFFFLQQTWSSEEQENDGPQKSQLIRDGFSLSLKELEGKKDEFPLLWSAFGNCLAYLDSLKLATNTLSMRNVTMYNPLAQSGRVVLDSQTLTNLNVLGGEDGLGIMDGQTSLLKFMNRTKTGSGSRLIRRWLCHPLRNPEDIEERLNAVEELNKKEDLKSELQFFLSKRKIDMERRLARAHYSFSSTTEFVSSLQELWDINEFMNKFAIKANDFESNLLRSLSLVNEEGNEKGKETRSRNRIKFPGMTEQLQLFRNMFDWENAFETKVIQPRKGASEEYDEAQAVLEELENELEAYRKKESRKIGVNIKYIHQHKITYQFEILLSELPIKKTPEGYMVLSKTAKCRRFHTKKIQDTIREVAKAKDELDGIREGIFQNFLSQFNDFYSIWKAAIDSLTNIDALISLAEVSAGTSGGGKTMCRPKFLPANHPPYLDIGGMYHPCMIERVGMADFVCNDVTLGSLRRRGNDEMEDLEELEEGREGGRKRKRGEEGEGEGEGEEKRKGEAEFMLLSGPNMGGKSTLLRQVCIAVVIGHMGCYVPAEHFTLTPVDRIFTRVGASDNIAIGRSTFLVELLETSTILNHATRNSLVILDELGRGTSTFDGYAVAFATTSFLSSFVGCRGIFATHYFNLSKEFEKKENVCLSHMTYHSNGEDMDDEDNDVTFLYKMAPNSDPNSFGRVVAKMAGIPKHILERAKEIARSRQGKFLLQADVEFQKQKILEHKKKRVKLVNSILGEISQNPANESPEKKLQEIVSMCQNE